MKRIAFLIPCFNEELTIKKVVSDCFKAIPEAKVYVYDNNSTDNTALNAKSAGAIVVPEPKQGKGNVVKSMFKNIDADVYIMVDGDDTYGLESSPQMVSLILDQKVDMVIGDRLSSSYYEENKRLFHGFGNRLVKGEINILFQANISDAMTGYRAFSKKFVKSFNVQSKGFEIETEMSVFAVENKFKIASFPIEYRDRPNGSVSKLNTATDGIKVLLIIYRLFRFYKPLRFNLYVSLLCFALGIPLFVVFKSSVPYWLGLCFIISGISHLIYGLIKHFIIKKRKSLFRANLKYFD